MKQSCITCNKTEEIIDLTEDKSELTKLESIISRLFGNEFKRKFARRGKMKESGNNQLLWYLNEKLKKQKGDIYDNYYKVYSIDEEHESSNGFSIPSKPLNACVVFKGHASYDVPHELMHVLGLYHTFTHKDLKDFHVKDKMLNNAEITYKAAETDNIMDYGDWDEPAAIKGISTFCWQWKILREKLEEVNND